MRTRILIGGHWRNADSGRQIPVLDPADDSLIAEVPDCGGTETEAAIEAAESSSPLKGADFGRSRTGRRLRFFFMADIGFGPMHK